MNPAYQASSYMPPVPQAPTNPEQAMILAELKAIKALISEIGIQKLNGVIPAAVAAPEPQPVAFIPEKPEFIHIGRKVRVPYDGAWVIGTVENVNKFEHQALVRIHSNALLVQRNFGDIFPDGEPIQNLPPAGAQNILQAAQSVAPVLAAAPEPQPAPASRDKFLALVKGAANGTPDEAERYLNSCSDADLISWEKIPADIVFPTAKLFFEACRRGILDLETTHEDNLPFIFHKRALPIDHDWFKNRITPVTAARLRALKILTGVVVLPIVEFLCTTPCCLVRMQFAWELLDTEGNPVFPAADFWRHTDFLKGDLSNLNFVRWWAKNVIATQEMPELLD